MGEVFPFLARFRAASQITRHIQESVLMIQMNPRFRTDEMLEGFRFSSRPSHPRIICGDLLFSAIALLTNREIDSMTHDDLKDAVRIASSLRPAVRTGQNTDLDDALLRRLLYLLRRMVRVEMDQVVVARGRQPYFREVI